MRFETPPGEQAQVDFAQFEVIFADEPGTADTEAPPSEETGIAIGRAGDVVARRSLDFYDAVARRLAAEGHQP